MPLVSVMAVAELAPVNAMVTPDNPETFDVTWPEMLGGPAGTGVAVKLTPVISAPLTVLGLLVGLKVNPVPLGVMV